MPGKPLSKILWAPFLSFVFSRTKLQDDSIVESTERILRSFILRQDQPYPKEWGKLTLMKNSLIFCLIWYILGKCDDMFTKYPCSYCFWAFWVAWHLEQIPFLWIFECQDWWCSTLFELHKLSVHYKIEKRCDWLMENLQRLSNVSLIPGVSPGPKSSIPVSPAPHQYLSLKALFYPCVVIRGRESISKTFELLFFFAL